MALQIQPFVGTDTFTMNSFNNKITEINKFVNHTAQEVKNNSTTKYLDMQSKVDNMDSKVTAMDVKVDNAVANAISVPVGAIVIWSGSVDNIPAYWHLCDGTNGTIDLRDKFVLGAGNGYSVGATGGEATHTLTIGEMPSHSHSISYGRHGGTGQTTSADFSGSNFTETTSTVGGGAAHNNMPPYYALCYIQRIA